MRVLFARVCGLLLTSVLTFPGPARALPVCDGTLADVIGLGSCTIGAATFTFGPAALASKPIWFNGLTVSDSVFGPSAASVAFTPVVSATSAGFKLTGAFNVVGSASTYFPGSGRIQTGNRMDIQFGYLQVATPDDQPIVGVELAMGGASVSADHPDNVAYVYESSGGAVVYDQVGLLQLSDSKALGPTTNLWDMLSVRAWDLSRDSQSVAGFTDFTYLVDLQDPGPGGSVPEPASAFLLMGGLLALSARRTWSRSGRPGSVC